MITDSLKFKGRFHSVFLQSTANTNQVKYSVGMASKFGHLGERGILPYKDLVLGISMRADLQNTNIYKNISDLKKGTWMLSN